MGITGRYNFPGTQKAVRRIVTVLLAATSWGAWIATSPFMPLVSYFEDLLTNWLVNRGLIILDVGANIIDGVVDEKALTDALNAGILRVTQGRGSISPEEGKAIDDRVREAFDEDADLGAALDGVPVISSASLRAGRNTALQPGVPIQKRDDKGNLRTGSSGLLGQEEPVIDFDSGRVASDPNGHPEQLRDQPVRTTDWKDRRNFFRNR